MLSTNLLGQNSGQDVDSIIAVLKVDHSKEFHSKIALCDSLLSIDQIQKNDCNYLNLLIIKSDLLEKTGEFKQALSTLNLANTQIQTKGCKDKTLWAEVYFSYGSLYILLNEPTKAAGYINKGITYCEEEIPNSEILINLLNTKGYLYDRLDSQKYYFEKAYNISLKTNNIKCQELILSSLGYAYAVDGQNEIAASYLKKALYLAKERKALGVLNGLYNNLAGISNDPKLINQYLDSAIYFAKLKGDLEGIQISKENRAEFFFRNGKYKDAYLELGESFVLKDSLLNQNKIKAFAEMEQRFENEKKSAQIELLQKEKELERIRASRSLGINFGLGGALLGIVFVAFAFYKQNQKKQQLNNQLTIEKEKSDQLLLNILPLEVAEELKLKGEAEAKLIEEVTVLFTDFKGFSALSERLTPKELVKDLHECFTAFDNIMQKFGLEKIKTIGDAYMAAGGLPTPNTTHAEDVVKAALEIRQFMEDGKAKKIARNQPYFEIRIGVHTGPVVAGIVGVKKFSYDIWGDTVNTANRMESSGNTGKVNISGTTYNLIKDNPQFRFEPRGKIAAKGKGEIEMYFVS